MRVIFVNDLHLGLHTENIDRNNEILDIVEDAIDHGIRVHEEEKEEVTFVFGGDIFNSNNPSEKLITLFIYILNRLRETGFKTFIMVGNHDEVSDPKRVSCLNFIGELGSVYPNITLIDDIKCIKVGVYDTGPLYFTFLPHVSKALIQRNVNNGKLRRVTPTQTYIDKKAEAVMKMVGSGSQHIVFSHLNVSGAHSGSEENLLKKSTVFPQKIHGGYIKLEKILVTKAASDVSVKINTGGEIHDFNFQLVKVTPSDGHDYRSKIDTAEKEDFGQETYKPVIGTKVVDQPQHLADQTDRLRSFLFLYCQAYENKDLDKFSAFFAPDATENNRPFHELLPRYRRNFEMIESFSYRIDLVSYSLGTDTGNIRVQGKYFTRFLYEGTLKENIGSISMDLIESGESYLVKRLNYTSGFEEKVDKQPQWGPWVETGNKE